MPTNCHRAFGAICDRTGTVAVSPGAPPYMATAPCLPMTWASIPAFVAAETSTIESTPFAWIAPDQVSSEDVFALVTVAVEIAALCSGAGLELTWQPQYVAAFLVSSQVYDAATERLTDPQHQPGWEALARSTHEPVRSRCLDLASRCRKAA